MRVSDTAAQLFGSDRNKKGVGGGVVNSVNFFLGTAILLASIFFIFHVLDVHCMLQGYME